MSTIKQLLRLHLQGVSNRKIADQIGIYKGTVNRYIQKLKFLDQSIDELLKLEEPILEKLFSAGTPAYLQQRYEEFKPLIPYIEKELGHKHVTRKLLWEEYRIDHPDGYGYSQFCYHLGQLSAARKSGSAIFEHDPGHRLQVDFVGDTPGYIDRDSGEVIKVQVLITVLPYSNYTFAIAVPSQNTDDFLYALSKSLEHLGGVPQVLVPDNLKAAVIKSDRYEPVLNKVMEDFAEHYGLVVLPTRPRKPKDKPSVENAVKLIYQRVFARLRNQLFFSLGDLNMAIMDKVRQHNQTRMQREPVSRQERFLADEKHLLKALPEKPFEKRYYAELVVASNNCVLLARDNRYYSVPFQYIGKKTQVIYTRTLVNIYCEGKQIATHPREIGAGYTTRFEHFASNNGHQMRRSPDYYIGLAAQRSAGLTRLIKRIFDMEKTPELAFRTCDGLLNLQRKTQPDVFEEACEIAYNNDLLGYKRVAGIIRQCALAKMQHTIQHTTLLPEHENIRGKGYYN
jgi:transposase